MNNEQRYNEALERAKKELQVCGSQDCDAARQILRLFPELAESEDEKIRKGIIELFHDTVSDDQIFSDYGLDKTKVLAWLEKQGEIDLEHYKDGENEKRKFVGYGFLKCKGDFLSFKEGETYWLEYVGKDNYNVRSDNLLGQTFHIKPVELYTVFRPTTWLEKQGNIDKASYEIAEKEKDDFVSGKFIDCRKSFNEFKEGNSYWLEYIGNDTYIGRDDDTLNKKFHITPKQLYSYFTQQCSKGNNMPIAYGKYVDECLNEAATHFLSEGEDKYSIADLFYAGINCEKSWLEKQGEKKSADKTTSKFKVGDWIVDDKTPNNVFCVIEVLEEIYKVIDIDGDDYHIPHCKADKQFHLWTTQDAKDGDILCYKWPPTAFFKIAIFKRVASKDELWGGTYRDHVQYGGYGSIENYTLQVALGNNELHHCGSIACPATKEQRELLFQKMKEEGYEWDAEKKELRKIESKKLDADKVVEWLKTHGNLVPIVTIKINEVVDKFKKDFGL